MNPNILMGGQAPVAPGLRVVQLLVYESGTYGQQFRRPYHTEMQGNVLEQIVESLQGTPNFMPSAVAGVAGQFFQPQAAPEKEIVIPNGFNSRRGLFMMVVEHRSAVMQAGIREVITGWTDHPGWSTQGSIDPNMKLVVNSTAILRETTEHTPMGNRVRTTVVNASQVLADNNFANIYTPEKEHRMRPEDVYSTVSRLSADLGPSTQDLRIVMTPAAMKSRRQNAVPANYVAALLENHKNASKNDELGQGAQEILSLARGYVADQPAAQDPFLTAIGTIRGTYVGNTFDFKDLIQLDPNVQSDQITTLVIGGEAPVPQNQAHQFGQTQHWGGRDRETQVAATLAQAIPGLMMPLAIMQIAFRVTNRTIDGSMYTQFENARGLAGMDVTPMIPEFVTRLQSILMKDVSYSNQVDFAIEVNADLIHETMLTVSLNGGPPVPYAVPTFCDAMLSPVVTANEGNALNLAKDFSTLFDQVASSPNLGYRTPTGADPFGQI